MTSYRIMPNPFPGITEPSKVIKVSKSKKTSNNFVKSGTNGSLISTVLDESGSMSVCKSQTIEGYNQFINDQRKLNQRTLVTLCKFEGGNNRFPYKNVDIDSVPALNDSNYTPLGGTNLFDAIGKTINEVNDYLKAIPAKHRPSVIITIITDGYENISKEFNSVMIKDMVGACEAQGWAFMFLGANIDAFAVGSTFGMRSANTASYSTTNMAQTLNAVSSATTRMRSAQAKGLDLDTVYAASYTDVERKSMK